MASRIISAVASRRVAAGSGAALLGAIGVTLGSGDDSNSGLVNSSIEEFNRPSTNSVPQDWTGPRFVLSNKYPKPVSPPQTAGKNNGSGLPILPGPGLPPGKMDAPWLDYDFKVNPEEYCRIIKEYCWEGNKENAFRVTNNGVREWFHAPWMHYSDTGREPLNGLTFERFIRVKELSEDQKRPLQNWAIGFYNLAGASVFGQVWSDPSKPNWEKDIQFPEGSCTFKILLTDATDTEVSTMKGAPSLDAVIAKGVNTPKIRNNFTSQVRLIQADFAVRDGRSPIGWVFGTFMYDGSMDNPNPWDRLMPVGLQWGNDPTWTQTSYEANKARMDTADGQGPGECWINPKAEKIRRNLRGARPFWGWNGRLNGPADNYISSCASCHSTAQTGIDLTDQTKRRMNGFTQPPDNLSEAKVPKDDTISMRWFRNIKGEAFGKTDGGISADYSLQLMIGYAHYQLWLRDQKRANMGAMANVIHATRLRVPFTAARREDKQLEALKDHVSQARQGPVLD